jgi:murein hydrolase activator
MRHLTAWGTIRLVIAAAGLSCVTIGLSCPAPAQGTGSLPVDQSRTEAEQIAQETAAKTAEKQAHEAELKALEEKLAANAALRSKLQAEIAGIRSDRARLNTALIETTARTQGLEGRIAALETRLDGLKTSETAIRRSLDSRRGLITEVLAALQRMGRRSPPAVVVRPEDMLEAVRASIMLGSVVPELRQEIEVLASDLTELLRLRENIATDRKTISGELAELAGERQRLASLVVARQQREAAASGDAEKERQQADALAKDMRSVRDLVERVEKDIAAAGRHAEETRRLGDSQTREQRERMAALALKDPARLAPKIAFADTRGLLPLPASGSQIRAFGASDGFGGTSRGISLSTRPKALVSAPVDAWVAFAGPFRSFGHLLILNAGGGYYLLLAGMQRIDVSAGQFVLAGEPVAVMGEMPEAEVLAAGRITTGNEQAATTAGQPVLYVEFRKDGTPFDPGPWWAKLQGEKVRG